MFMVASVYRSTVPGRSTEMETEGGPSPADVFADT